MSTGRGCFCHPDLAVAPDTMDIDAALNELGMLSSVSDSRRQYLTERRRKELATLSRERKNSEPVNTTSTADFDDSKTASNIGTSKNSFQVLQINPDFVTHFSPGSIKLEPLVSPPNDAIQFGSKYDHENVEKESRSSRHARSRHSSRMSRFKKPYDIPWLQRHSIDTCYPSSYDRYSSHQSLYTLPHSKSQSDSHDEVFTDTPADVKRSVGRVDGSNNVPSKQSSNDSTQIGSVTKGHGHFARSKSLDELDFAKLRVAETETMNYVEERKEIETVSSCLQNLHVNE